MTASALSSFTGTCSWSLVKPLHVQHHDVEHHETRMRTCKIFHMYCFAQTRSTKINEKPVGSQDHAPSVDEEMDHIEKQPLPMTM